MWLKGKQTAEGRFSMCTPENPRVLPQSVLKIVVDGKTKDRLIKTYATLGPEVSKNNELVPGIEFNTPSRKFSILESSVGLRGY